MKPLKSPQEKRRHPRYVVSIPAGVYLKENPHMVFDAEIIDLSESGAFIHCVAPIQLGQEILVEFRFAETKLFDGKVVPHEAIANPPAQSREPSVIRWARGSTKSGFGVEFLGLKGDKKAFLLKLITYFKSLSKAGVSFKG